MIMHGGFVVIYKTKKNLFINLIEFSFSKLYGINHQI